MDYPALVDAAREHIEHIARGVPGAQADRVRRGENDDPRTSLLVRLADAVEALTAERDALRAQLDNIRQWRVTSGARRALGDPAAMDWTLDAILAESKS